MTSAVNLRGITWKHARGYAPMVATAQRFTALHPDITIVWDGHSLKDFEEASVEELATRYDLIVLDHPCISSGEADHALLPLDQHLTPDFLAEQAAHSVGLSHASYTHAGHQWALAIDAAAPVAYWRPDLLARHGQRLPKNWEEVIALAQRGHVEVPSAPINCLMNFYSFCIANGAEPFPTSGRVVERAVGLKALAQLRELLALGDPGCWTRNPIASLDLVASAANNRLLYCPFSYAYSNYARPGFAPHVLEFGETPLLNAQPMRTTLGGAGLAVSALRPNLQAAVAYAEFVASGAIQRTLYTESGGQPGHRSAWLDPETNRLTHGFFQRTLPVLDRAYLRPRFPGYLAFQKRAMEPVHAALQGKLSDDDALAQLDSIYRDSRQLSSAA